MLHRTGSLVLEPNTRESSDQVFVGSRRNVLQRGESYQEGFINSCSGRCGSPFQKQFGYEDLIRRPAQTPREVAEVLAPPLKNTISEGPSSLGSSGWEDTSPSPVTRALPLLRGLPIRCSSILAAIAAANRIGVAWRSAGTVVKVPLRISSRPRTPGFSRTL